VQDLEPAQVRGQVLAQEPAQVLVQELEKALVRGQKPAQEPKKVLVRGQEPAQILEISYCYLTGLSP
jgi:hypothetical protein